VIEDTPVDSGRAKSSWVFSDYAPTFIPPNEEKDELTGANKATFDKTGQVAITRVVNGLKRAKGLTKNQGDRGSTYFLSNMTSYIMKLEYGHSDQAPGGMVRQNLQRFGNLTLTHYLETGE